MQGEESRVRIVPGPADRFAATARRLVQPAGDGRLAPRTPVPASRPRQNRSSPGRPSTARSLPVPGRDCTPARPRAAAQPAGFMAGHRPTCGRNQAAEHAHHQAPQPAPFDASARATPDSARRPPRSRPNQAGGRTRGGNPSRALPHQATASTRDRQDSMPTVRQRGRMGLPSGPPSKPRRKSVSWLPLNLAPVLTLWPATSSRLWSLLVVRRSIAAFRASLRASAPRPATVPCATVRHRRTLPARQPRSTPARAPCTARSSHAAGARVLHLATGAHAGGVRGTAYRPVLAAKRATIPHCDSAATAPPACTAETG